MESSKKRKLPARAARHADAPRRKRISTPPEPLAQESPSPPPIPIQETLPTSLASNKPLPTVDELQPDNLSNVEYQTVAESGVLVESIQRSRQKWLVQGIFEKYYTKPTVKNKKMLEGNPAKDTMTKLGSCSITVEPHVFDAIMYGIKEPKQPAPPTLVTEPQQPPIIQYGPPNGVVPQPLSIQAPSMPVPIPVPVPLPVSVPVPVPAPVKHTPLATPQAAGTPNGTTMNSLTSTAPVSSVGTLVNANGAVHDHSNGTTNSPARNTDPVIQMLAERAATDLDLKGLMKIVANGEASAEELKKFQAHIDELSRLLKLRQASAQLSTPSAQPLPSPRHTHLSGQVNNRNTSMPKPVALQSPAQPQALRSKGPPPSSKFDFSGIALEFAGGNGDRYLFPKFSILEYVPGGQVIASFLIVRKGSASDSPVYDPELDYYQPITIRLYTHQGRQLESLQKVVAPADDVRKYMDDIMDNVTRAEYVLLATRLPREIKDREKSTFKSLAAGERAQQHDHDNDDDPVLWVPASTKPLPPVVIGTKPTDGRITEEDQYQSFIRSVAAT